MKVIVVASQKGGVGKTTLSINLATAAAEVWPSMVYCADTDPQASMVKWFDARRASGQQTPLLLDVPPSGLARDIKQLRYTSSLLFIDTPPAANVSIGGIIALADVVIIPVRPSLLDMEAIGTTIDLYRANAKPGSRFFFVVTQAGNRSKAIRPAIDALQAHGEVCPHIIYSRIDYQDSLHGGSSVIEHDPWGRSANEIRGVLSVALQTEKIEA